MKNTTQYLYGIDPKELIGMEYKAALEYKKAKAKELFAHLFIHNKDADRQFYVWKAREHTDNLLEELENKE